MSDSIGSGQTTDSGYKNQRSTQSLLNRLEQRLSHRSNLIAALQLLPAVLWILMIFGLAMAIVVIFSFLKEAPPDGPLQTTLTHYQYVFEQSFYFDIVVESLIMALKTTVATLALSYPPAYYLAFIREKRQNFYLLLLILPFWINIVIRTFAWRLIFNNKGLLNWIFVDILGVVDEMSLLFTNTAVTIGLIHVFLPFMIIPIYTTLANIDKSHIEAAKNLGANKPQAFYEVTLPQSLPGVAAGVVIVYILAAGAFVTPLLLGGQKAIMVANIIGDLFTVIRAWGTGSALAMLFTIALVTIIYVFNRTIGLGELYGDRS